MTRRAPQNVSIPVGESILTVSVPNLLAVMQAARIPGVPDVRAEIRRAIEEPIGSAKLEEIARGKRNAAIIVNDITRPYPGGPMVEELAAKLAGAGFSDKDICLVIAYGNHRKNTEEECRRMFGGAVVERFRIVHHDALDPERLVTIGATEGGVPVQINKEFAEADVRIATGCITPHASAGFSGGRKSVMPGIAGIEGLKRHHSFPIRPKDPKMGWLEGNPFHEEALAVARMAKVDFIINAVENAERELVVAVAGDLDAAHKAGVAACRNIWGAAAPSRPDVVIVSPGGYPRDFDLHQSQKAVSCAELLCKPGGRIILCAEARDGVGKFGQRMKEAAHPQVVVDQFEKEGFAADSSSKAYMWCRGLLRFSVGVACSSVSREELEQLFMKGYDTVEEAIADALKDYGEDASFVVIPHAAEIVPRVGGCGGISKER
jgi:nickel-dependent lactate racemase